MKYNLLIASVLISILCVQCNKNNDQSNSGNIQYQLVTTNNSGSLGQANTSNSNTLRVEGGTFSWTSGTGNVTELKFEAKSATTEIEYKTKVKKAVNPFNTMSPLGGVLVPPGTYDKVEFRIHFESFDTIPALELKGSYTNSAGVTTPIDLKIQSDLEFKFEKSTPTTIDGTTNYSALSSLALNLLFSGVSETMLNGATKNSAGIVVISPTVNSNLYKLMLGSADKMLKVEIK
jgi:hypothetical protein